MPKKVQKQNKQTKNIKNIYIKKINSLFKATKDSHLQIPCLNNVRRPICTQDQQSLLLHRKQNNKDAARKARERKKIYMNLLQEYVKKLQKINQESKQLEKSSTQILQLLSQQSLLKNQDQIGQYLIEIETQKAQIEYIEKDCSKATMDFEKQCQLNKIVHQIEKIVYPIELLNQNFQQNGKTPQQRKHFHKMQTITSQIPQIFMELKTVCSDHASLHVLTQQSKKTEQGNPYICKTLMQQYYSQTLCRKDISNYEVHKFVSGLSKLQSHFCQVKDLIQ